MMNDARWLLYSLLTTTQLCIRNNSNQQLENFSKALSSTQIYMDLKARCLPNMYPPSPSNILLDEVLEEVL